jgi:RNA polymerase sigma factor (sigma-70 family)
MWRKHMKHSIEFKGFSSSDSEREKEIRRLIEDRIQRVEKKLRRLAPDEIFMRVVVEENPARTLYRVSTILDLPEKALVAKEEQRDPESAVREAFAGIDRQTEEYKASRRGEHDWKRLVRREELRLRKIQQPPDERTTAEVFFNIVEPHLDDLIQFARTALSEAEAKGDLGFSELTPEDLADATLLRAYREFAKNPTPGDIKDWLLKLAAKQLDVEIQRSRAERRHILYIEEGDPEPPLIEEPPATADEDFPDFNHPNQILNVEEAIPELELPSPEQEMEREELRQGLRAALREMPETWRRVLLLRFVNGLTGARLAQAAHIDPAEVDHILESARNFLRQRLIESGCVVKSDLPRTTTQAGSRE